MTAVSPKQCYGYHNLCKVFSTSIRAERYFCLSNSTMLSEEYACKIYMIPITALQQCTVCPEVLPLLFLSQCLLLHLLCACVCVCVCVGGWVRAWVCACARACV